MVINYYLLVYTLFNNYCSFQSYPENEFLQANDSAPLLTYYLSSVACVMFKLFFSHLEKVFYYWNRWNYLAITCSAFAEQVEHSLKILQNE